MAIVVTENFDFGTQCALNYNNLGAQESFTFHEFKIFPWPVNMSPPVGKVISSRSTFQLLCQCGKAIDCLALWPHMSLTFAFTTIASCYTDTRVWGYITEYNTNFCVTFPY